MYSFDFPIGVHALHSNVGLDFQLNRLAGVGGGDLPEIREAARRIQDLKDWQREFMALADRAMTDHRMQRAGAFEPRIRRVVAFDVMWDFFEVMRSRLPPIARVVQQMLLAFGAHSLLDRGIRRRMRSDPLIQWAIEHGCYVLGVETPSAYIAATRRFTTRDISSRIKQDFLLLAGNADHYIPIEHYHAQARALTNTRSFTGRIFTAEESAQTHCQVGNVGLALGVILSWIDERTNS